MTRRTHMTPTLLHSFAMLPTAITRTVLTGLALVATPALLIAQDCLGFHAPRAVPVMEITAGFLRDGVTGPSTLGIGATKGALFGLLETGADVAAERSAFAMNGYGATMGYRREVRGIALCGGASLSGESMANGTTSAGSIFAAAGVALPARVTRIARVPLSAFGMAALGSRTTSPNGGSDLSDQGLALRAGLSSYPREWIGVRVWEDLADGEYRFGMSISLNRNIQKPVGDSDGDGVLDPADACPNTPLGTRVDAVGCPLPPPDTDGDGVIDANDACPDTPRGTQVDGRGCPLPPPDADGDGVIDAIDACPNTPAGTKVDATGCPLPPPDADGDGVPDTMDACPATPPGTSVDEKGCPPVFVGASFTLTGVTFETSKAVLRATSIPTLDDVAAKLLANPTVRVEISGHTDNTGNAASNLRLSQARAEAVRAYFIGKGVAADRLTARGFGSSRPVATNGTVAGRAENRRVELTKID